MELSSISIAITSLVGALFSPGAMFTTGVNGAWYDPSDFSTMFQDAAGTTPVTAVGQPVGLMLDKSKGLVLGPELVTNGDGSSATGWTTGTSTVASVGGALMVTSTGNTGPRIYQSLNVIAGRTYTISVTMRAGASNALANSARFRVGSANSGGLIYAGPYQVDTNGVSKTVAAVFTAGVSPVFALLEVASIGAYSDAGDVAYFDNISVRELPGNHAYNPSGNSANFPVLSARYNLLTKTEDFSTAVWNKAGGATYANNTIAPDGTLTGVLFIENTSNTNHGCWQNTNSIPTAVNSKYIISLKYHSRRYVRVAWVTGGGLDSVYTDVDLIAGTIVNQGPYSGATQSSVSITSVGSGWYTVEIKGTLPSAVTYATVYARNSSSNSNPESALAYTGDGVSGFYVWHPDLRVSNDALNQPSYQRVNTATDYDTVGFKSYLSFNGVNQWLQTNSIDFTYGDKMFVSAGVRKLADGAEGTLVGFSTSSLWVSNGFELSAPQFQGSKNGFGLQVVGNLSSNYTGYTSGFQSPVTSLISGVIDIGGASFSNQLKMRVNGSDQALTSASNFTPTGNFTTQAMFIGNRGGAANWFNGRLYGLVVAGKQASASEIASTEAWLNQKTGAY